jgi:hypothetical protein
MTATKNCRCGHGRDHPMVSSKNDYTLWGWFWLYFGVTVMPKCVRFVCTLCGEELARTTDPKEMEKYRFE